MSSRSQPPSVPLAVSIGEPAGIGPDVLLRAWQMHRPGNPLPPFFVVCDPDHLGERAALLGLDVPLTRVDSATDWSAFPHHDTLPVMALENGFSATPGREQEGDAKGVVEAIATAVETVREGFSRGIVTLPINKKSLYDQGFDYPGHTEYLGALAGAWPEVETPLRPVMMLAGPDLKTVPVTIHIPLKDVPGTLTTLDIVETATIVARDLTNRFGIARPRLAISGLNPHAGESGALGNEDEAIVAPAIAALKDAGIECFGPLPADTMFHARARAGYDVAICMYHDQALIPAKALAFDESVNVTLGLPFVRTSPDHGTAYDIAGTGKANPASFVEALRLADRMTGGGGA